MNQDSQTAMYGAGAHREERTASNAELAAIWAESRAAYPIYAALATQFELAELPHPAGEMPPVRPTRSVFDRDLFWLDDIDDKVLAFQIRQLSPSILEQSEETLRAFIQRQLKNNNKTPKTRDKVDLLLVKYFAQYLPEHLYHQEISIEDVARSLQPVLGATDATPPEWCEPLNGILQAIDDCRSLRDLLEAGLLEQGRLVKEASGPMYYNKAALIAFCRFNFLLRRAFIRLLHADLQALKNAIHTLQSRGTKTVDCRRAGFSAAETTSDLRRFCENWRQPFQKDYTESSVNASFEQLLALRADLEEAAADSMPAVREFPIHNGSTFALDLPDLDTQAARIPPRDQTVGAPEEAPAQATSGAEASIPEAEKWLDEIHAQLCSLPAVGRAMSTISLQDTKVLLSSWESSAFTGEDGPEAEDLRRVVLARALLSVGIDRRKRSGERTFLATATARGKQEFAYFQSRIDRAKQAGNSEAAVNLAISAKRLQALIEAAEQIQP